MHLQMESSQMCFSLMRRYFHCLVRLTVYQHVYSYLQTGIGNDYPKEDKVNKFGGWLPVEVPVLREPVN